MSDVSLIEFYAPWCSPCMYMKSVVEKELENNLKKIDKEISILPSVPSATSMASIWIKSILLSLDC